MMSGTSVRNRMVAVSAGMSVLSFSDVYLALVVTGYLAVKFGPVSAGVAAAFAGAPWLFLSGYGGRIADTLTLKRIRKASIIANAGVVGIVGCVLVVSSSALLEANAVTATLAWGSVMLVLGCAETIRNSLARVALMDMDPSGGTKTWFARIDRAAFMIGLSLGGVSAALFPVVSPVFLGLFLIVTMAIAMMMFVIVMPAERVDAVARTSVKRRGIGLVPPRGLPWDLVEALWVLTVIGFFCIQTLAMWPITAAVFPFEGLLGWMRVTSALFGLVVLVVKFSTEKKVLSGVWLGGIGMVAVCATFSVGVWCENLGWTAWGVAVVLVGAAMHGAFVGLLLTGTRQLGAILAPSNVVGEVTGWTSLPANGFAVVTGPIVGVIVLGIGAGWMWGILAVAGLVGLLFIRRANGRKIDV